MRFSEYMKQLNETLEKLDEKARAALAKALPKCFTDRPGGDVAVNLSPLLVAGASHGMTGPLAEFSAAVAVESAARGPRWAASALHTALKEGLSALKGKE